MSIAATDTATTAVKTVTPVPHAVPGESSDLILLSGIVFWCALGLIVAKLLGVFRRRSINGPPRIAPQESAWTLMIIICGAALLGIYVGKFALYYFKSRYVGEPLNDLIGAVIELSTVFAAIVITARVRQNGLRQLGVQLRGIPTGVGLGSITILIAYPSVLLTSLAVGVFYQRMHWAPARPHELLEKMAAATNYRRLALQVATAVVVAPLTEEIVFRGFVQTMLGRLFSYAFGDPARKIPDPPTSEPVPVVMVVGTVFDRDGPEAGPRARWAAVVMTSTIFALIHPPATVVPIFVLALVLGYLYERSGNLWANVTLHALFNATNTIFFLIRH